MAGLTLIQLRSNPFRVLGLPASAGQADIFAAARRMRIYASPAEIPATDWDIPLLGTLARARTDIEQSVSQLSDPITRLEHRQRWFGKLPLPSKVAGAAEPNAFGLDPRVAPHDQDLWRIARLFLADPSMKKRAAAWEEALLAFCASNSDEGYLRWLRKVEKAGNFDKVATKSEVKFVADGAAAMIAEPIAEQARDALDHGQVALAIGHLRMLKALGTNSELIAPFCKGVFDRMEDNVVVRCNQLCEELRRNITWGAGGGVAMKNRHRRICGKADEEVARSITPLLHALLLDELGGSERIRRVSLPAARMLRNLGNGWVRGNNLPHAKKILLRAKALVEGTAYTRQLDADLDNVKQQTPGFFGARGDRSYSQWWLLPIFLVFSLIVLFNANSTDTAVPVSPYSNPQEVRQIQQQLNLNNTDVRPSRNPTLPDLQPRPPGTGSPPSSDPVAQMHQVVNSADTIMRNALNGPAPQSSPRH